MPQAFPPAMHDLITWQRVRLKSPEWTPLILKGGLGLPIVAGTLLGLLGLLRSSMSDGGVELLAVPSTPLIGAVFGLLLGIGPAIATVLLLLGATKVLGYINIQLVLVFAVIAMAGASFVVFQALTPSVIVLMAIIVPLIMLLWVWARG